MSLVVVNVSAGSTTTTLPLISSVPGGMITIKDSGSASSSNTITIATTAGNTFETGTYIINTPLGYITFLGIGTRWRVIATTYPNVPAYTPVTPTPGVLGPANATINILTAGQATLGNTTVASLAAGTTTLNTLSTIGQAAFFSSVQVQGGLSVFSSITARNINFTGILTSNGVTFSGAPAGINSAGSIGINSASNASYSLLVTGNQSNTGTLNVTGQTSLVNSSNTGTLGVAGTTTLTNTSNTGTLGVAGTTTLTNTSNTGTLGVAGTVTFGGTFSANASNAPIYLSLNNFYYDASGVYATTTPITIAAGNSAFNGNGSAYVSANDLLLKGQDLNWVGNTAAAASILLQSGRSINAVPNGDNQIQFNTAGVQRGFFNASGLTVTNTSNTGTLGVAGTTTLTNTSNTGTLGVAGLTTLVNSSNTGTLGVAGATTLTNTSNTGTLGVAGTTTLTNTSNTGTLGVAGYTTLTNTSNTGTLGVAGATTLTNTSNTGTLGVAGTTTLTNTSNTGTLGVAGYTTLSSNLTVGSGAAGSATLIRLNMNIGNINWSYICATDGLGDVSLAANCYTSNGFWYPVNTAGSYSFISARQGAIRFWCGNNGSLPSDGNYPYAGAGVTDASLIETMSLNSGGARVSGNISVGNFGNVGWNAANRGEVRCTGNGTTGISIDPASSRIWSYNWELGTQQPLTIIATSVTLANTSNTGTLGVAGTVTFGGTFSANASNAPIYLSPAYTYWQSNSYVPTVPITIAAGLPAFNGNGLYTSAHDLLLKGQDLTWVNSGSAAASILIQSGRSINAEQNSDNQIQFNTAGVQRGFFSESGLTAKRFQANGGNMTARTGGVYNYDNVNYSNYSSSYYTINWIPGEAGTNTFDTVSQGCAGIICSAQSGNAFINFYVNNMAGASNTPTRVGFFNSSGFNANAKNFSIDHPVVSSCTLVHASIEGPRYDLIYRNSKQLINGSAEVDIEKESTANGSKMSPGTFDALCTNADVFLQNNDTFDRVKGHVSSHMLFIECENSNSSAFINWMIIAERHDSHLLNAGTTDASGFLILEHYISTISITSISSINLDTLSTLNTLSSISTLDTLSTIETLDTLSTIETLDTLSSI